jgi:nucleoside-diphosphate-sugar epimerase
MKCLVTGCGGYIGDALSKRLVEEKYDVVGLIHNSKPVKSDLNIDYIRGDLTEINSLIDATKDIDIIFHCAGFVKEYGSKKKYFDINFEGIKKIVSACQSEDIKRFIYLGRIRNESFSYENYYAITKSLAEDYLLSKYKFEKFPVIIIRPGNVFGPGATKWVIGPIESIKNNKIALINNGEGIFLHTYIENLLDALILSIKKPNIIGKVIEVTDGDNSITIRKYFNDLASIIGKKPITKNISRKNAILIGRIMLVFHFLLKIKPWITPTSVDILTNKKSITIGRARSLLGYEPKVNYETAMIIIKDWLDKQNKF